MYIDRKIEYRGSYIIYYVYYTLNRILNVDVIDITNTQWLLDTIFLLINFNISIVVKEFSDLTASLLFW